MKRIALSSIGFHNFKLGNNWNRCKPTNGFEFVNSVALQIIILTRNSSALESLSSVLATIWDISPTRDVPTAEADYMFCRRIKEPDFLPAYVEFHPPRCASFRFSFREAEKRKKIFRKLDLTTFFLRRRREIIAGLESPINSHRNYSHNAEAEKENFLFEKKSREFNAPASCIKLSLLIKGPKGY